MADSDTGSCRPIDFASQKPCRETEFIRLTRAFPSRCLVRLLHSAEAQTWISRVAKKGSLIRGQRNVDVGVTGAYPPVSVGVRTAFWSRWFRFVRLCLSGPRRKCELEEPRFLEHQILQLSGMHVCMILGSLWVWVLLYTTQLAL